MEKPITPAAALAGKPMHEANRMSWNAATVAHNSHKGDQARFFRSGGSTLFPEELELLGPLDGLELLHLQCNAGQDSLSLARLGARVTGVDISDTAIAFARQLAADSGVSAQFERADVFDWIEDCARQERRFDRVFSSYGALCWLSDLDAWARGVAGLLKAGGQLSLVEFHPYALVFDPQWTPHYDYFNQDPIEAAEGVPDYVAASGAGLVVEGDTAGLAQFSNPHPSYEFQWGLGQLVTALARAGLVIECLTEYPYANGWKGFEDMVELDGRRMAPPARLPKLPLMYGLRARKP